jgi:ABC-type polysaccharide/polyol phosphate transport system ATPase subunit
MRPGEVVVEGVSRRFRVNPARGLTLKDAFVRRRELRSTEIWALRDVSVQIEPGESVGLVGRNGSGKSTLLSLVAEIIKPTAGRVGVGGPVGSLLELGAGFHPDFSGRENVLLTGSVYGLRKKQILEQMDEIVAFAGLERFIDLPVRTYSSGMYMRLGFAIATHVDARVLLLDEVFAVGDEAFQRKCFGKIFEFKSRGGTIVFVSHDASAVERLCERAVLLREGRVEADGSTRDVLQRYHALLAADEDPEERGLGLREWGTGELRIVGVRLEDLGGEERVQVLSGEPVAVVLQVQGGDGLPPPRLSLELRDEGGGLLAGSSVDAAELGWSGGTGATRTVRFELDGLPLADGRFSIGVSVADGQGSRVYHRIDRAADFLVYPDEEITGAVRLDGRWTLAQTSRPAPTPN